MKVAKQVLIDMDLPDSALECTLTDTSRWSIHYEIIFEMGGKFYSAEYQEGATESQDEQPWAYVTEVEITEVQQVEKTVKVWEPIKENA